MFKHEYVSPAKKDLICLQENAIANAQKAFRSLQKDPSKQYPSFSWTESPLKLIDKSFEAFANPFNKTHSCNLPFNSPEIAIFFGIAFKTEFLGISHNFEGPLNLYYDTDEKVVDYFFDDIIKKEYMDAFFKEEWKITNISWNWFSDSGKIKIKYPSIENNHQNFISKIKCFFANKKVNEETFNIQRLAFFKEKIRSIIDKDLQEQKMNLAVQEAVFYKLEKYLAQIDNCEKLEKIINFSLTSNVNLDMEND